MTIADLEQHILALSLQSSKLNKPHRAPVVQERLGEILKPTYNKAITQITNNEVRLFLSSPTMPHQTNLLIWMFEHWALFSNL